MQNELFTPPRVFSCNIAAVYSDNLYLLLYIAIYISTIWIFMNPCLYPSAFCGTFITQSSAVQQREWFKPIDVVVEQTNDDDCLSARRQYCVDDRKCLYYYIYCICWKFLQENKKSSLRQFFSSSLRFAVEYTHRVLSNGDEKLARLM